MSNILICKEEKLKEKKVSLNLHRCVLRSVGEVHKLLCLFLIKPLWVLRKRYEAGARRYTNAGLRKIIGQEKDAIN